MTSLEHPEHRHWLAEAQEILDVVGIDAVVIGGVAAIRYRSLGRVTRDLDFLSNSLNGLDAELKRRGYETTVVCEPDGTAYLIRASRDSYNFDFILAVTEYQLSAIARAKDGVIAPEDVIVHKLIAWRERDRSDIRSIIESGRELDVDYIQKWAKEWDVTDRLPPELAQ